MGKMGKVLSIGNTIEDVNRNIEKSKHIKGKVTDNIIRVSISFCHDDPELEASNLFTKEQPDTDDEFAIKVWRMRNSTKCAQDKVSFFKWCELTNYTPTEQEKDIAS